MKKLLTVLLAVCISMYCWGVLPASAVPLSLLAEKFTDVRNSGIDDSAWYIFYLDHALENSFFLGTSKSTFTPGRDLYRSEAVTVLGRVHEKIIGEKIPEETECSYPDVEKNSFYSHYVGWAQKNGLLDSLTSSFQPRKGVTREDMALLFYRYVNFIGIQREVTPYEYGDVDTASPETQEAIRAMAGYHLFRFSGHRASDGTELLLPKSTVSRGESTMLFVTLYQMLTYPIDKETPRLKYVRTDLNQEDELGRSWPLSYGESRIITSLQDYNDFMAKLPSFAKQEKEGALLTVEESTFTDHCVIVMDIPIENYTNGEASCVVSGDTAEVTFTRIPGAAFTGEYIASSLYLLKAPKAVTNVTLQHYNWVEDWYPAPAL